MNRIEAAFYLFQSPHNQVVDTKTGVVWYGIHRSPVTNTNVLPVSLINKLPDSEFKEVGVNDEP